MSSTARLPGQSVTRRSARCFFAASLALTRSHADLPFGKEPIDIIVDYLTCLWRYAKERITEEIGSIADLESANVLLTVPAQWDAAGCSIMRQAAIKAGMVQSSRAGDKGWRERLRIITRVHISSRPAPHTLTRLHAPSPQRT